MICQHAHVPLSGACAFGHAARWMSAESHRSFSTTFPSLIYNAFYLYVIIYVSVC